MTAKEDDKYCSHHLTKPECEGDGCLWLEDGHKPFWGNSLEKQICVDKEEYGNKSGIFASTAEWDEYVKRVEAGKAAAIVARDIQDRIKAEQDKLAANIALRKQQAKDLLLGKNVGSARQALASAIKQVGDIIPKSGGSINRSPSLYNTTKQHYLNLKSMY